MAKEKKEQIINRYTPQFDMGLLNDQIQDHIDNGLVNEVKDVNKKGYFKIIIKNLVTFFNIIYVLIAILLLAVGTPLKEFTFLFLVVLNALIGTIQEIRSKRTIDRLTILSAPTVTVVRNGVKQEIKINEIVLDDIIYLTPGREITTDGILVEGEVEVNESQLTGESVPIRKTIGSTLFSGSYVVSGNCYIQVERVGNETEIAKLAAQAKKYKQPKSGILNSLNKMLQVVAVLLVFFGVLLFLDYIKYDLTKFAHLTNPDIKKELASAITSTTTALVGMIPQGLYFMTTIALSVGVIRLAKKQTLVQDIYCIEMLARVDVLCLDKTGTITDGTMSVVRYIEFQKNGQYNVNEIMASINKALQESNSTSKALENYFGFSDKMHATIVTPFSSDRKFSAVTFGEIGTYIMGAPEFVLKGNLDKYSAQINEYANQGLRVIALVHSSSPLKDNKIQKQPKLIALILIEDQIRKEAYDTIKYFKENGVLVKVISGDNPVTVAEVARRVGVEHADFYISLDGLSDDEVYDAAEKYTVFGRVKPHQKQIIVKALKDHKHTVAMTGDGVNDILALKEADCSIAMASGSDAVKSVAKLVLLDSNFASMPNVVSEGRRVINNIQKTSMLFFVKTLFIIILAALTISGYIRAFSDTQGFPIVNKMDLFLLEFFAIGVPSFFIALQPNNNKIKGNFLVNALKKALPGALAVVIEIMIVYALCGPLDISSSKDANQLKTIVVLCATYTSFMIMYMACQPFTWRKVLLFGFCSISTITISFLSMYNVKFILDWQNVFDLYKLHDFSSDGKIIANPLLLMIILFLLSYTFITAITHFLTVLDESIQKKRELRERRNNYRK